MSDIASVPLSPPPRPPPARSLLRPRPSSSMVPPHPPVPQPPPPSFPRHPPTGGAKRVEFSPPFRPHPTGRGGPGQHQPPHVGDYRHQALWHHERAFQGAPIFQMTDGRRRAMSRDESKLANRPVPPSDSHSKNYIESQTDCLFDHHSGARPYSNGNRPMHMCQPASVTGVFSTVGPRMPSSEVRSKSGDSGVKSLAPSIPGLVPSVRPNTPGGGPTVGSPSPPNGLLCDLYVSQVAFPGSDNLHSTNLLHLEFLSHLQSLMCEIDPKSMFRLHGAMMSHMQIRAVPLELSWDIPISFGTVHGDIDPLRQLSTTLRRQQPTPLKYLFRVATPMAPTLTVTDLISNISCEITMNNNWGVLLSQTLHRYGLIHPSIQIATQLILHYGVKCGLVIPPPSLDSVPDGQQDYRRDGNRHLPTLSNLSVLLVLWLKYLIETSPSVPNVSQLLLGGLSPPTGMEGTLTVESLLARFFTFYRSIDLGKSVISIRVGAPPLVFGNPSTTPTTPTSLMVIDPFIDRNLAGSWSPNDVLRLIQDLQRTPWSSVLQGLENIERFNGGRGGHAGGLLPEQLEDPSSVSEWLYGLMDMPSTIAMPLQYEAINIGSSEMDGIMGASVPSTFLTRSQLENEIRRLHLVQGVLADRVRFARNDRWWAARNNPSSARRERTDSCMSGISVAPLHWSLSYFMSNRRSSHIDQTIPAKLSDSTNGSPFNAAKTRTPSEGISAADVPQRPSSPQGGEMIGVPHQQYAPDSDVSGLSGIPFQGSPSDLVSLDHENTNQALHRDKFAFGRHEQRVLQTSSTECLTSLVQRHFDHDWNWNNSHDLYTLVNELLKEQPGWYSKLSRIEARLWASFEVPIHVRSGENSSMQVTAPGGTVLALFPEGATMRPHRIEIGLSWSMCEGIRIGTAGSLNPIAFQDSSTTLELVDPQWMDIASNGKMLNLEIDTRTGAVRKTVETGPTELLFSGIAQSHEQASLDLWRIPTLRVLDEAPEAIFTIHRVSVSPL